MFTESNIGPSCYTVLTQDWIYTHKNDPHKHLLINIQTQNEYDVTQYLYDKGQVNPHSLCFIKPNHVYSTNINISNTSPFLRILDNTLDILTLHHTSIQKSNPTYSECNVNIMVQKFALHSNNKLMKTKTHDINIGTYSNEGIYIYRTIKPELVLIAQPAGISPKLRHRYTRKLLLLNLDTIDQKQYNIDWNDITISQISIYGYSFTGKPKTIIDHHMESNMIPINHPSNHCVILDINTMEEYEFTGKLSIKHNTMNDTYEYVLTNNNQHKIIRFKFTKDTARSPYKFDARLAGNKIILKAFSENGLEEYNSNISYTSHDFISNIKILHRMIDDAVNHRNPELTMSYHINQEKKCLEVDIDIDMAYFKDALHYILEKKKCDRLDILEKKVAILYDKYSSMSV